MHVVNHYWDYRQLLQCGLGVKDRDKARVRAVLECICSSALGVVPYVMEKLYSYDVAS